MRWVLLAAVGVAVVSTALVSRSDAADAGAGPRFGSPRLVASVVPGGSLQEVAAADVTGDGNSDEVVTRIVVDRPQPVPISVLVGDGHGGFRDATAQVFDGPVPMTMWARRTVLADFNGDGRTDMLIADTGFDSPPFAGYPNTLVLSAPGGKLVDASANLPRLPDFTHSAAAADVDGNGTVDLYLGNLPEAWDGGTAVPPQVLLNDGSGHFRISTDALPSDLTAPLAHQYDASALVDVNGDGSPDLVLASSQGTPNRILLNDRAGHFHELAGALPAKPWGIDAIGLAIAAVDLNRDGRNDLLIGYTKNNPFYKGRWIQVLINNGDGSFRDETAARLPQNDNLDQWPYTIHVADLNGDGNPDIAVSLYWYPPEPPPIFLNKGDGTFSQLTLGASVPPMFALLDANKDDRLDIIGAQGAGSRGIESHYLIEQLPPPPGPVAGVRASRGTFRDGVHLSWQPTTNADRYEIWRTSGTTHVRVASLAALSFDDRHAQPGVHYRYTIRAANTGGPGAFSGAVLRYRSR